MSSNMTFAYANWHLAVNQATAETDIVLNKFDISTPSKNQICYATPVTYILTATLIKPET